MLDKLKEYRDIISLVVFFLTGFLWIEAQFATKAALMIANCRLDQSRKLGQLQTRQLDLQQKMEQLKSDIEARQQLLAQLAEKPSPSMLQDVVSMQSEYISDEKDLGDVNKSEQSIGDDMVSSKCGT